MRDKSKLGKRLLAMCMVFTLLLSGCGKEKVEKSADNLDDYKYEQELQVIDDNSRTYYEVFVYSFYDSDGDGIGDLNGVTEKLDYIQNMGFNGIWLMPIMPSPTYHKYDTTDYCDIDPQYGTLDDFKKLLEEAHKRDINVIIDFMMNHTSNEHTWFQTAYTYVSKLKDGEKPDAEECPYVEYYHFIPEEEKKGSTYYQVGNSKWYYEGSFWSGMPDLNLESEVVRGELEKAAKFWLDLGVDGFRLDGVKYFVGGDEKNAEVLSWFNDYVKGIKEDAYMVSEVWDNYNIAAEYLKSGVDSTFDFTLGQASGTIATLVRQSATTPVGDSWAKTMMNIYDMTKEANENATTAEFLTNHDTGRMANILAKEDKIKLAYAMELFCTGNVFVYYGEEIGLAGSGSDENFRRPMYWSETDKTGMTKGPENMDYYENLFAPVDEQLTDPNSILYFVRRCIRIRNENPEIARGSMEQIPEVTDEEICAITKTYEDSTIAMLYNMSTEEKKVTLSKDTYGYEGIRGYVSAYGDEVTLDGENITLPPYSVVVLK